MLQVQEEGKVAEEWGCALWSGTGLGRDVQILPRTEVSGHNILRGLPSPKSLSTMQKRKKGKKQEITTHFMSSFHPRISYFPLKEKPIYI